MNTKAVSKLVRIGRRLANNCLRGSVTTVLPLLARLSSFAIIWGIHACFCNACAQGTLQWTVTFDGPPAVSRGDAIGFTYYYEGRIEFRPIEAGQFVRAGGGRDGFAENGTAYLLNGYTHSLSVTSFEGVRFGAISVDLAEFSTLYQTPKTVEFIGYRPDGSTVTEQFVTDGIIDGTGPIPDFETFYFDSRFADLVKLELPGYGYSLDNFVFSNIPEPSTAVLLLAGALLLGTVARRRRHNRSGQGGGLS